jgi:hypothetical protein
LQAKSSPASVLSLLFHMASIWTDTHHLTSHPPRIESQGWWIHKTTIPIFSLICCELDAPERAQTKSLGGQKKSKEDKEHGKKSEKDPQAFHFLREKNQQQRIQFLINLYSKQKTKNKEKKKTTYDNTVGLYWLTWVFSDPWPNHGSSVL